MKKVITIMCVAAAPILFAQEKSMKAHASKDVKVEQQAKIKSAEAKKAQEVKALEAKKKAEVKATQAKGTATGAAAAEEAKKVQRVEEKR